MSWEFNAVGERYKWSYLHIGGFSPQQWNEATWSKGNGNGFHNPIQFYNESLIFKL